MKLAQINFHFEQSATLTERTRLKNFIRSIFIREKTALISLDYIFTSDQKVLEINQQFLQHNFFTDIISFELQEKGAAKVGEIYISIDRVRENAEKFGKTFKEELHRVIFHGALHLCGYGDKTKAQKEIMTRKEDECLGIYFK